jgi:hypothetical protein
VGAGNSAGQAAIHLARFALRVTIVVRGQSLTASMSDYLIRQIGALSNIDSRLGWWTAMVTDALRRSLWNASTVSARNCAPPVCSSIHSLGGWREPRTPRNGPYSAFRFGSPRDKSRMVG